MSFRVHWPRYGLSPPITVDFDELDLAMLKAEELARKHDTEIRITTEQLVTIVNPPDKKKGAFRGRT